MVDRGADRPPYERVLVLLEWARALRSEIDGELLLASGGLGGFNKLAIDEMLNVTQAYIGRSAMQQRIGAAVQPRAPEPAAVTAAASDADPMSKEVANENARALGQMFGGIPGQQKRASG